MKAQMAAALWFLFALVSPTYGDRASSPIADVVALLDKMKAESLTLGETERDLYAKAKCYCDENEAEKKQTITDTDDTIKITTALIEETKGSTGELSLAVSELKASMEKNREDRQLAEAAETKAIKEYQAFQKDMTDSSANLKAAIDILLAVAGDTQASDHAGFMGKQTGLLKLSSNVKKALLAAKDFLPAAEQTKFDALLQNPGGQFTGTYTGQSTKIVGILQQMKETFDANLQSATSQRTKEAEAHNNMMILNQQEWDDMDESFQSKNTLLGENDDALGQAQLSLNDAKTRNTQATDFLNAMLPQCETKAKEFEARKMWRASEEAAFTKAIQILSSEMDTFGKVGSTSGKLMQLKFVQLASVRRHSSSQPSAAQQLLETAAQATKSARLAKVAALVASGNPFVKVIAEIKKMQALIKEEAKADKQKKTWCDDEREKMQGLQTDATGTETTLNTNIASYEATIKQLVETDIVATEAAITSNSEEQKKITETRREENEAFRNNVANIEKAVDTIGKAIAVLEEYYADLAKHKGTGLVATRSRVAKMLFGKEEPDLGETWDSAYTGKSQDAQSSGGVIAVLKNIQTSSSSELTQAKSDEKDAQDAYDGALQGLKDGEKGLQDTLTAQRSQLSQTKATLQQAKDDLFDAQTQYRTAQHRLDSIKADCDFFVDNFDKRNTNRGLEEAALQKAIDAIEGSPAYQQYK